MHQCNETGVRVTEILELLFRCELRLVYYMEHIYATPKKKVIKTLKHTAKYEMKITFLKMNARTSINIECLYSILNLHIVWHSF